MININFVPDDYIENRQSRRTNTLYTILFFIIMSALVGTFGVIKLRQHTIDAKSKIVNEKLSKAKEAIKQLEQLRGKRELMMKGALAAMQLIEPVPRSVLLASLTNNLPVGVSLLRVKLVQSKAPKTAGTVHSSKYQAAKSKDNDIVEQVSNEKLRQTHIEIKGLAPSNIHLASYIEALNRSVLLDDVKLVLSKETEVDAETLREFELTAKLKQDIHLSEEDINTIRIRGRAAL